MRFWARLKLRLGIPVKVRLPFGAWWMPADDFCSHSILRDDFESAEWRFVERFLEPGMTVLDIGAHHGFYSLLAAGKVGSAGRVIAFEPSPREREKLLRNIALNGYTNIQVEDCALADAAGQQELVIVGGINTGCNSLRPPNVKEPTSAVAVRVETLDAYLAQHRLPPVDFIKLDAEGAELAILKGARRLLESRPRPVIQCELEEVRTRPWGYHPGEIVSLLDTMGYRWFQAQPRGVLRLLGENPEMERNFFAVPEKRMDQLRGRGLLA
jgi:FkbM family methyltransferase